MRVVSKRRWFSYTTNFFTLIFICMPALSLYWYYLEELISPIWKYSVPLTIAYVIYQNLRSILLNLRKKWIFEEEVLTIKSGLLPWRRNNFSFRKNQIFDIYYRKSFLGTILNYGHLSIRRTDGTTSHFDASKMTHPKKMAQAISTSLNKDQPSIRVQSQPLVKSSYIEDLQKLSDLHTSGKVSDDEFQRLKASILKNVD